MKFAVRTSLLLFALLITVASAYANGPGGGHGGGSGGHGSGGHASGGHGGGHAGHAAGHFSSGNASTHSFAHSFGHIFHHGPRHRNFTQPSAFFPRHRRFGSFFCDNDVFFPTFNRGLNCFNNGFFLDPFFFGAFSMLGPLPDPAYADLSPGFGTQNEMSDTADAEPPSDGAAPPNERSITLLQLLDGSMYGLTSYKVVGHDLHYTTTYGAQNSVPLDRIDFTQTLKLNADRHVPFLLAPKSPPR
jgi:hypothetical protein